MRAGLVSIHQLDNGVNKWFC